MRSRPTFWILLTLLLAVGAWFFWPQGGRRSARQNAALKQKISTPNFTTSKSASTAPMIFTAKTASTNSVQTAAKKKNPSAYRLSNTKKTIGELASDPRAILLANAFIDTDARINFSFPKNLQAQGDPGAYIVQANGPIDNAFRAMLAAAGAQIVSYIPNNAYLVRASAGVANELAGHSQTEAVIPYEPYYKINSSLLGAAAEDKSIPPDAILNLGLFADNAPQTVAQIEKLGGKVLATDTSPFGPIVRVLPPADWTALAALPGVQIVELFHQRASANDLARVTMGVSTNTTTGTNYLGLTGKNVVVEVNDTGIDATHPDFSTGGNPTTAGAAPQRVIGDSAASLIDTDGHGTHVAGVIAGNGAKSFTVLQTPRGSVTNADFRGKAPLATLYSVGFLGSDSLATSDRYLQETPARTNALISNNSWVNVGDNSYDLAAASYDAAVRDALPQVTGSQPVLFVFAAGNEGGGNDGGGGADSDTIDSPGTAKNVITVGALEQLRNLTNIVTDSESNSSAIWKTQTDSSSQVAGYSSRGNVGIGTEGAFGRFKPDVVAPGSFVVSTRSQQWDQNAYYNPTNFSFKEFDNQVVDTNGLQYYSISVPQNAVGVNISILANGNSPFPFPNLPIYVERDNFPTTTVNDFSTANNQVSIPPDSGGIIASIGSIQGLGFNYGIGDSLTNPVSYDVVEEIMTTNDTGNLFMVLSNLNNTLGPDSGGKWWYRYESGTSIAAPSVSGVLALMQDYFTNTLHLTPSPALLKAMLINGARSVGNYASIVTNSLNDEGWGLVNLTNSLPIGITNQINSGGSAFFLDQSPTNALATGDSHTFNVTVVSNAVSLPFRVTLAWTDPPGDPAAAIKLVNNLDLVVSNKTTHAVYFGNDLAPSIVDPTIPAASAAWNTNSAPNLDSINNVENVLLPSASVDGFTVMIVGRGVNVNAVTAQTNNVVQDFALVISSGNGQVTNALTVTDAGIISNPTTDQLVTFVTATNAPLFNQFAGASTPLLGTNQLPIGGNFGFASDALVTLGMTNQWHFYVVTNNGENISNSVHSAPNAAFVTFLPDTLSIPRMGVYVDSVANATRPEADIDLYVASGPNAGGLTNLDPTVIASCVNGVQIGASSAVPTFNGASLGRGGTEFVVDTNSQPGQVYYIGVKSEDQNASEYGFLPVFSATPFSQMGTNGDETVNGLLLPVNIPDGTPAHPGIGYVFGLAIQPMEVQDVAVNNQIWHQNFGDLVGTLNHNDISVVLNNHDGLGNTFGSLPTVYDDSGSGQFPGSQPSDGPGSLQNFTGTQAIGPWILTEVDNSLTQTGIVTAFQLTIQPHQDLTKGINIPSLASGEFFMDFIDVPVGFTNLTIAVTNFTPVGTLGPLQVFIKFGSPPTVSDFDEMTNIGTANPPPSGIISIGPPLQPGRYFVGIFNPGPNTQGPIFAIATLAFSASAISTVDFDSSGPVPILDDAVTLSSISVPDTDLIQDFNVGLRVDHPRISDLVFHLISPDGTRYLLMENRGGTSTNGAGISITATNSFAPVNSNGSSEASTNNIDTGQTSGTITINYNFFSIPDEMIVQYQGSTIFDSGEVSGVGTTNIPYGPGSSTEVSIIMNPGSTTTNGSDAWQYTVSSTQAKYSYLTFTEDTNLTTTPIKFAPPPFVPTVETNFTFQTNIVVVTNVVVQTNTIIISSFEPPAAADYVATNTVDGWRVISNQVTVVNSSANAFAGNQFLALANGSISNTLPTPVGSTNTLSYAYRGPGIISFWRGEGGAVDSIGGNNGTFPNNMGFAPGEVGNGFNLNGVNQYILINPPVSTNLDLGLDNGFTVDCWIKPANTSQPMVITEYERVLGSNSGNDVGLDFGINLSGLPGNVNANIKDTSQASHSLNSIAGLLTAGVWQHIAVSYDKASGVGALYLNGAVVAQTTFGSFTPLNSFTNILLGARTTFPASGFLAFSGGMDEISFYNRALSSSEFKAIFTNGTAGKFDPNPGIPFPQKLAEARVALSGVGSGVVLGANNSWQTNTVTFIATQSGTPLQIDGIEPGMLLDSFTMLQTTNATILVTNITIITNMTFVTKSLDYLPEQDISALNNQSAFGNWQLEIQDDRAGATNNATLVSWQLEFTFAKTNFTVPPVFLSTPPNTNINELTTLVVANPATNFTTGTLTYALLNPPDTNITISATGIITWTPSEAEGPGDYVITTVATDSGPPSSSATNSFVVSVNEVNSAPFWATNVPSQTNYFVNAQTTLTVTNTATDTDIPANPLTYVLVSPPTPTNVTIDANGIITWTPTYAQATNTPYTITTIVTDTNVFALTNKSLSATNSFTVTVTAFPILTNGMPQTNSIPPNSIVYYAVVVPTNADWATNILLFASGPVNLLFNQSTLPTGTNTGDFTLLTNSTGGIGSPILGLGTTPPLSPGSTYYLGVQNTNSFAVTNFAVEVDFHLVNSSIFISSIVATNLGGKFGFLLSWFAPTDDVFQVQWTPRLAPANWQTFTNIIPYTGPPTPTNGLFTFFDDASQTGGVFDPTRFYRLILLGSVTSLTNDSPQTNTVPAGGIKYFTVSVPTNADFATNILDFASAPVNLLFNQSVPPNGTNAGDFLLLTNSTGGIGSPILGTNTVPPLIPGSTYYLGVKNTNSFPVNFAVEVDFHLRTSVNATNVISVSSIVATNGGFLLTWFGPTNDIFRVQWTASLAPASWQTFSNLISYDLVISPTNSQFNFFDNGSQTGGTLGSTRFYRLVLSTSAGNTPPVISGVFVNLNGVTLQWSALTNEQFQVQWKTNLAAAFGWNTFGGIISSTNGLFTFLDDGSQSGGLGGVKFYRLILFP
jgi:subtilisin-like proprotein convertase family protein